MIFWEGVIEKSICKVSKTSLRVYGKWDQSEVYLVKVGSGAMTLSLLEGVVCIC